MTLGKLIRQLEDLKRKYGRNKKVYYQCGAFCTGDETGSLKVDGIEERITDRGVKITIW